MKKLFALLAVVLAVVSCQKDADLGVNVGGEQLVNITVALPEATRADSAVGALKNNVLTDHNLRFILEIYNVDTKGDIDYTDCYRTQSIGKDTYTSFPVRLVPGHEYKIVVWADFVQNDVDTYYNTANGLDEITFIAGKDTAMTEARDAYYAVYTLESNKTASSIPTLTLKRPFAKIRVITTDLKECAEMSDMVPTQATITYTSTVNDKFNAVNKQVYSVSPNCVKTVKYPSVYGDASTLFVDYILVDQFNPSVVNFNLNTDIVERPFNTDIAVEANKLTTITGNILTDGTNIEVKVDGEFNEPGNTVKVVWVSDATELTSALNTPNAEVVLTTDITLDQPLSITNNATIDGNGNAFIYTGNGDRVIDIRDIATRAANNGTVVTIKNLSIDLGNKSYERGINYNSNGKLILDNVKVVGTNVTYALNLPGLSDNCEVEINNCEFKGNIALNVWGENAVINVNNSILTSVDNSTAENYAAINLNKDAEGTVVNVNGGKIIAKNENGEPYAASNNATVSGKINISETTEVIGDILVPVATVTYTTTDDYYTCTTLQEAIDKAAETPSTATVTLIKNIESSEIITVSGKATINGNGHTITSTAGRAINVSGATDVTIKNLNIVASGERAINVITDSKKVTIENVTATAANYTVNVAASAPNAVVAIKNSTLNGLCTVNVASAGANVTVEGSTVNCNDNNTTAGESYAALCLNKEAVGGKIIATNSTINVTEGSDSTKGRNGAENGEVTINGGIEGVVVMVAAITYPDSNYYHAFQTIEDAFEFAESKDVITLIRDVEQKDGILITDKNITIDLNGKTFTVTEGANTNNHNFKVNGSSVVTIKNGTMVAQGDITSGAYGTLRTEGTANVTLEGVKLYNYRANGFNVKACSGTTVTINDTEVYSQYGGGVVAVGGIVELTDVKIEQKGVYSKAAWNSVAIGINSKGKVTVNSGNYSASAISTDANATQGTWVAYVMSSGGTLDIKGGTFNGVVAETAAAANACGLICADTAAVVDIHGGTFNSNGAILDMRNNTGGQPNPKATLYGGTFSADPRVSGLYASNLIAVAAGYQVIEQDGKWVVM